MKGKYYCYSDMMECNSIKPEPEGNFVKLYNSTNIYQCTSDHILLIFNGTSQCIPLEECKRKHKISGYVCYKDFCPSTLAFDPD